MATRASVVQQVQIGLESTSGTSVPAGKLLEALDVQMAPKVTAKEFRPQGRKYASQVLLEQEWAESKYSGIADFQSLAYVLSCFGAPVVTTVFTTATQRIYTPVLTGLNTQQSFTVQKGSAVYAEQMSYALFNSFNLKIDRKELTISGDILSQTISEGVSMTATPTVVAAVPILGNMANIYLDPTSGALGTTLLTDTYEADFSYGPVYGAKWPINRANASFGSHVDVAPKCELKLKMQADAVAAGLKTALEGGATQYLRVNALGGTVGTAGNYQLTLDLAMRVNNIAAFSDTDGIYTVEYTMQLVEDPAWTANGQAALITLVNNLSAL